MTEPRDKWDYDVPEVAWVTDIQDGRVVGHHPEPKFGMSWPHIQTLQHLAALIEVKTGIRGLRVIKTDDAGELFEIRTPHAVMGGKPYIGAFNWLDAFETGVWEARRSAQETPHASS